MTSRHLSAALLATLLIAPLIRAEIGLHPQSLGIGKCFVFDKDSVFCPFDAGKFKRVLQINPSTKAWKWVNDADYPASSSGAILMKNRNDGVMINVSGNAPFLTKDGWKTLTQAKPGATDGIEQIVLTETGYAGHGVRNKSMGWSADGETWNASDPAGAGSGAGTLASFKNKVVIWSGASFFFVSTDGGKKYETITFDPTGITSYNAVQQFRMFSADSFLLVTNNKSYTSVDGGKKWAAGKEIPNGVTNVIARGWKEFVGVNHLGKIQFTSDAGETWTSKDGPNDPTGSGSLVFIGDDLYLWPNFKSKDMGATWTPWFPGWMNGSGVGTAYSIAFNGDFGAVGYSGGKISYTFDRGRSFTLIDTIPGKQDVMALKILKNNRILAGDRNGQTFISTDTGLTWTKKLTSNFSQNAIKFSVSEDEKVQVLTRGGQPTGSGDNGEKWDFLPAAGGALVQTVKPNGTIIGMVNMEYATLFLDKVRTKIDTLPPDQDPVDIVAVTDDLGWLATRVTGPGEQENRLYKTTDGFKTFSLASTVPKSSSGQRLLAVTPDFLALYSEGRTWHWISADGGKTWNKDSLDVHSKYTAYPSILRVHYFNPKEQLYALGGNVLYINTGGPGSSAVRPSESRPSRQAFYAVFDAGSGSVVLRGLGSQAAEVGLYDLQGRRVLSLRSSPGSRAFAASLLGKGMYFIRARTADGRVHEARFLRH